MLCKFVGADEPGRGQWWFRHRRVLVGIKDTTSRRHEKKDPRDHSEGIAPEIANLVSHQYQAGSNRGCASSRYNHVAWTMASIRRCRRGIEEPTETYFGPIAIRSGQCGLPTRNGCDPLRRRRRTISLVERGRRVVRWFGTIIH